MNAERKRELALVLRRAWDCIKHDYAGLDGVDVDGMAPFEIAEVAGDYVSMYGGTQADLDELCRLSKGDFVEVAGLAFGYGPDDIGRVPPRTDSTP